MSKPHSFLLLAVASSGLLAACTSTRVIEYPTTPGAASPHPAARPAQVPAPAASTLPPGVVPAPKVSTPKYGATYVVKKGDTVYHISTTNGITPLDLALWNDVPPPYIIHPGQRLRLFPRSGHAPPPPPNPVAVVPPPAVSTPNATRPPVASLPPPAPRPRVAAPATPVATPVATRPPVPAPVPAPAVAGNLAWRWPTDGAVLSTYLAGDPARQGLDIGGTAGAPVRAAAEGTVVYSGAGLVGYGELIIVKHNSEWLSAYGHNRKRLVKEGQRVSAGQQIAELGRTAAPRDMLHFEIRYDGKPVDPLLYLPRK